MHKQPLHILLVEDNPGDAFLISSALQQRPATILHQVTEGQAALDFLRSAAPLPHLMLLDLNLPQMDGYQVLEQVKTEPRWRHLPVIILSTSRSQDDIVRSYRLHANCYLTKPLNLKDSTAMMHALEQFWLSWAALPSSPTPASL